MYKHGVAYVERGGPVNGEFELSFRVEEMNDVLKSLAVAVAHGDATVGAVAFETPTDPASELRARNLLLVPGEALTGLLEALRGRTVELATGDQRHRGEVIGFDAVEGGMQPPRRLLALRAESGAISLVDLDKAGSLELVEDQSRDDLDYLIDRSRAATAGENRIVRVQITGQADDLRVSYVVPAPAWRVSYRLVRNDGTVVLIAMGIVHNPVDEALDDVQLTLTTGQPISFDIDLYHSKRVQRAVVEEQPRAAAPPISYPAAAAPPTATTAAGGHYQASGPPTLTSIPIAADSYAEAVAAVETGDRGEHFEYRLTNPISLKRGGAAMVPLAVASLDDVRKERIWREGSGPAPDIVLAFANSTGVVLEEGPAVVYDDGSYAGEVMLPFSARGADLRLTFAKDLAVRCRRASTMNAVTAHVRLGDEAAVEEQRQQERHTLRAENDHDEDIDVIFELHRVLGHTLRADDDVAQLDEETATHQSFRVRVPAHGSAEAVVLESWLVYRTIDYQQLSPDQLDRWLKERFLDWATISALSGVLAHREQAGRLDAQVVRLQAQRAEVSTGQGRIADQLKVLGSTGREGELRNRYVYELEAMQNRIGGIEAEISRQRDAAVQARAAAAAELQRVIAHSDRNGE
jgi:hypothetical protein